MQTAQQIARHFRDVHTGGNWTSVNLKETLSGISWQQATTKVGSLNTIAALVFHIHYYVEAVLKVLRGGPLDAHDRFSFDVPPIVSEAEWEALKQKVFEDAEAFAALVEQLGEERLSSDLADPKYGTYYRNLHGIIEHTHYHLGQIALLKKILGNERLRGL